jgi:hypothetical protein
VVPHVLATQNPLTTPTDKKAVYRSCKDDYHVIKSTMLFAMEPELQNRFVECLMRGK